MARGQWPGVNRAGVSEWEGAGLDTGWDNDLTGNGDGVEVRRDTVSGEIFALGLGLDGLSGCTVVALDGGHRVAVRGDDCNGESGEGDGVSHGGDISGPVRGPRVRAC